ncbi:hypothetical protein E2R56_21335 [Rhodococcus qingshengii]|nr:hypothetical protein E2R56_21335 [Rhodococcus qingshengii]
MNEFNLEEKEDRISITSSLTSGWNGVIIEIVSSKEALVLGIHDLESFITAMKEKNKACFTGEGLDEKRTASFVTWRNDLLQFSLDKQGTVERFLNGQKYSFDNYPIM